MMFSSLVLLCTTLSTVRAVTVYGQVPLAQMSSTATSSGAAPAVTLGAYNSTTLNPPIIPNPPPARQYTLQLPRDAGLVNGLSIPHVGGSFWGFSLEMSILNQVLGKNSSFLSVPLLNLMANLEERAGGVVIRIGGNTQEFAAMVDSIPNGHTFMKVDSGSTQTTKTPAVLYTRDMFYMANNISSMVNVKWFFGIPFNDTNWRLAIAEEAQAILGDNLLALQAGNEPDFYLEFKRRTGKYDPIDYLHEVQDVIRVMDNNPKITNKHMLLGPSVASAFWTPEMVWETGFIDATKDRMYAFTVERYPDNNCVAAFGNIGDAVKPQDVFPAYLEHGQRVVELVKPYINSANLATAAGKPFFMFETNTASCGGFFGVSDTYGAALWAMDYGFQMAYANFTHAMLHVGGQNAFYNPFTSPPTNQSAFNQWTVGAVYYSTIVLAEAFGKTNTSRIIDLGGNGGNVFTPSYAIYEKDVLSKVALFNYVNDKSGQNDLQVTIQVPQGNPSSVQVKYLAADSVSSKFNISWAGQTLGNMLTVDGRFRGSLNVVNIPCGANGCTIPVPAPGFALVFLDNTAEPLKIGQATQTFATTAHTKAHNTATYDPSVLATSNGHSGMDRDGFGSTSSGSVSAGVESARIQVGVVMAAAIAFGAAWIGRAMLR